MKFKTHRDKSIDVIGTSLLTTVTGSVVQLTALLGQPEVFKDEAGGESTEWAIEFVNDEGETKVATIYQDTTHLDPTAKGHWKIGAHDMKSALDVSIYISLNT